MAIESIKKDPPHKLLAQALVKAKSASREGVLKAADLERGIKERLAAAGCLIEIIKGWYLLANPGIDGSDGSSTAWFGSFWAFLKYYLSDRFGEKDYCLSAEASIDIYSGENFISNQITIITKKNSNQTVNLLQKTSLFLYTDIKNFPSEIQTERGINIMPLDLALSRLPAVYYSRKPLNSEIILKLLPSVSTLSRILLETQSITAANRLVGAYTAIKETAKAKQIEEDMKAAGFILKPTNPFQDYEPVLQSHGRLTSPYAGRIQALWSKMRPTVIGIFPKEPGLSENPQHTLEVIQELYSQDAYHSLSIEGYQVTQDLIQKIADGNWNPENNERDRQQTNALAAKGYYEAFDSLLKSVGKVFKKEKNSGDIFEEDLQMWYRNLFTPSVQAGLIKSSDLAGYRNSQVYIRNSRYVPLPSRAVTDSMETLFKLLKEEKNAAVRAVLGHFIFVYIHPYMDGNGRTARFLMNLMMISGGYNWTVVRVERRKEYMEALEQASVYENIGPFAKVIFSEMEHWRKLTNLRLNSPIL